MGYCKIHPETQGTNTCNACGCRICDECAFERSGRLFCPHCAAQMGTAKSDGDSAAPKLTEEVTKPPHAKSIARKHISWGILFLFSVIPLPGLNYMYMGLIKRGILAMSAFFVLVYVGINLSASGLWPLGMLFWLSLPILICVVFFDGFLLRRRINSGETIYDSVDDILALLKRHRRLIILSLAFVAGLNIFNEILPRMGRFWAAFGRITPIIVVAVALYFLLRKK